MQGLNHPVTIQLVASSCVFFLFPAYHQNPFGPPVSHSAALHWFSDGEPCGPRDELSCCSPSNEMGSDEWWQTRRGSRCVTASGNTVASEQSACDPNRQCVCVCVSMHTSRIIRASHLMYLPWEKKRTASTFIKATEVDSIPVCSYFVLRVRWGY